MDGSSEFLPNIGIKLNGKVMGNGDFIMALSTTYSEIGTSRNRGTPKTMLDCYWVPDFKKRLAFFLRIPQDWCRFNQFGFPNMINTMEYYRIVICLCSSLRPFSFSHHFPIFSHRCSHIFHNCRICVHNFRRFFP